MSPLRRLRRHVDWVVRHPNAEPEATQPTTPVVDASSRRRVVDLALRASELALAVGGSASDATRMAYLIGRAYQLDLDVDVTYTSVTISHTDKAGVLDPITAFRTVRPRAEDYQQLARVQQFVANTSKNAPALDDAIYSFSKVVSASRTYRRWFVVLAGGVLGAFVAMLMGGNWIEMLLAGIAMMLLDLVQFAIVRANLPTFFTQAIGAAVPTATALAVMYLRATTTLPFWQVSPSLVGAAGMVSLLAGLRVVTAARDALEGYVLTASARTFEVIVQTAGIILGVLAALWLGLYFGIPSFATPADGWEPGVSTQLIAAGFIALSFAVRTHIGPRSLPAVGLIGVGAFAIHLWALDAWNQGPLAVGLASLFAGGAAQVVARRWAIPAVGLVTSAVVALVPGMSLYRGLYQVVVPPVGGMSTDADALLLQTVLTGVAIAAGSTLGAQLIRPLVLPADRVLRSAALRSVRRSGTANVPSADGLRSWKTGSFRPWIR